MNKVTIASLLAASAVLGMSSMAFAQIGTGQVTMDPAEFADYDNAVNKQTTPQTQAPALEAYLSKYPKSAVKADVLQRLMIDYYNFDHAKAIDAADRVLQVTPNSLQAYTIEVAFREEAAQALTDPAAKQSGLDSAADFAAKGLAVSAPPAGTSAADFAAIKAQVSPTLYSAIGTDDLNKKDSAGAEAAFKSELGAVKLEQTTVPGTPLQDTFFLGYAYSLASPPDYLSCAFYTTRAASYAPDNFKAQFQPTATYCYKKFHGGTDGYDVVVASAKANLFMPSDLKVTPAPTNEDIVKKTIADTPDLATLAIDDKEFIIAYGKAEDADKVFATVKGKTTEIPDAVVVKATADQLQVSVGQEAIQGKTADFSYNMKTPLTRIPEVGSKINLSGTYASYTQSPLLIIMSEGEVVAAKKTATPVKKAPVRRR